MIPTMSELASPDAPRAASEPATSPSAVRAEDGSVVASGVASDPRLAAWRTFLMAHALVTRRLDDVLHAEHGISLAEYDALVQLAYSPGRRLRMNQLADRVLLSRSGVTRLVDRLEADGFVTRMSCPSDARGAEAVLTDGGLATLRQATATHLRGVERYFFAALDVPALPSFERALEAVVATAGKGATLEACGAQEQHLEAIASGEAGTNKPSGDANSPDRADLVRVG